MRDKQRISKWITFQINKRNLETGSLKKETKTEGDPSLIKVILNGDDGFESLSNPIISLFV